MKTMTSYIALALTTGLLLVSFVAATKNALVGPRREAINHIRNAYSDIVIHGNINEKTVHSLREASQLADILHSSEVGRLSNELYCIAFRLQNKSFDQKTDKDWEAEESLKEKLDKLLYKMRSETTVNRLL